MSFRRFLNTLRRTLGRGRQPAPRASSARSTRPLHLELLEDRLAPAVTAPFSGVVSLSQYVPNPSPIVNVSQRLQGQQDAAVAISPQNPGNLIAAPDDFLQLGQAGARESVKGDVNARWDFVARPDHPVFSGDKSVRRSAEGLAQVVDFDVEVVGEIPRDPHSGKLKRVLQQWREAGELRDLRNIPALQEEQLEEPHVRRAPRGAQVAQDPREEVAGLDRWQRICLWR